MYKSLNSPSHITLAICVRVRVTGNTHITRVLGMGMPKMRGYSYHCDTVPQLPGGEVYNSETSYSVLKRDCKDSREGIFSRQC